jgi:hypothetical protein
VANIVFSICAAVASLAVAVLAAARGVYVVSAIWAALAIGFVVRASYGRRRLRR